MEVGRESSVALAAELLAIFFDEREECRRQSCVLVYRVAEIVLAYDLITRYVGNRGFDLVDPCL